MGEREPRSPEERNQPDKEHMPKALFELGDVYVSEGVQEAINAAELHPAQFLARHVTGDWEFSFYDIEENRHSLVHGWRIFSAYDLETGGRIYILTESDRSATTLITPDEL